MHPLTVRWILLLALVAVCALFVACDNLSGGKAVQPELTARATRDPVLMIPNWQPRERIGEFCPAGQLGCSGERYLADGVWTVTITVVEPRDFNDFNATESLGHECWHGFGAKHKKPR